MNTRFNHIIMPVHVCTELVHSYLKLLLSKVLLILRYKSISYFKGTYVTGPETNAIDLSHSIKIF